MQNRMLKAVNNRLKKRFFWLGTSLIIFVFSSLKLIQESGKEVKTNNTSQIINVDISRLSPHQISPQIFGFNMNVHSGHVYIQDVVFSNELSKINPSTLRFPGGEISNYYHWETGTIDSVIIEKHSRLKGVMKNFSSKYDGKINFDQFMLICKRYNIKPLLVVNMYTALPKETAEWAKHVKNKQYEILGWELGNELYLPRYRDRIDDIETYSQKAKRHAQAIKQVDSSFVVGVNSKPSAIKVEPGLTGRSNSWNLKLSQYDFYDAFSLHIYLRPEKMFGLEQIQQFGLTERVMSMKEYTQKILKRMDDYPKVFLEKKMWLSEWNIHDKTKIYPNSTSHQLWYADFLLQIMKRDYISSSHYNVIVGPNNGFPLFTSPLKNNKVKYLAIYDIAKQFGEMLQVSNYLFSEIDVSDNNVSLFGLGKNKESVEHLIIINFGERELSLNIENESKPVSFEIEKVISSNKEENEAVLELRPTSINFIYIKQ